MVLLRGRMNDSVIFGKFLEETNKFKGSLQIGFFGFTLSKAHAKEVLLKVVNGVGWLGGVTLEEQKVICVEECHGLNNVMSQDHFDL